MQTLNLGCGGVGHPSFQKTTLSRGRSPINPVVGAAHMPSEYTDEFYQALQEGTRRSARAIVPLVLELIDPRSVIDVGCGIGIWLSVFKEYGVSDILGIDGDYVNREMLEIPAEQFLAYDLTEPLEIGRQFDLVVSLEVAEHLPSDSAGTFVDSLTRLGPVILFSAAIPFQGGTHHVNEQWPDYWVHHFQARGYLAIDPIRKHIWQNADVDFWYTQNSLIFVRQEDLDRYPLLREEAKHTREAQLSIVHPRLFLEVGRNYSAVAEAWAACQSKVEVLKLESARHKEIAQRYLTEAETYRTEAEAYRKEVDAHKAQAEALQAQVEAYRSEAEEYKTKADPRNMSFRGIIKAFPTILVSAIKRKMSRPLSRC
jgi:SAM-dependent methyltransferase